MKVRIGNEIYDSNNTPIMLILNDIDKNNIKNMDNDKYKFITYPKEMSDDEIRNWINNINKK